MGHFCRSMFLKEKSLEEHKSKGKCNFPTMNARTHVLHHASKPGGALENGSRPDRRSNKLSEPIVSAIENSASERAARCYQCFNRCDRIEKSRLTDGQLAFLLRMFGSKSKKDNKEIHKLMKIEQDPVDNGLMFCPQKAHLETNGGLLSEDTILSWLSRESQNQKKKKDPQGTTKLMSLKKNLGVYLEHKAKNPTSYWKINGDNGNPVVSAAIATCMFGLLSISGGSKMKKAEKIKVLQDLDLAQATMDNKLKEMERRIEMLKKAIEISKTY